MDHGYDSCSDCLDQDRELYERHLQDEHQRLQPDFKDIDAARGRINEATARIKAAEAIVATHTKIVVDEIARITPALKRIAATQLRQCIGGDTNDCLCGKNLGWDTKVCPHCGVHRHGWAGVDANLQRIEWFGTVPMKECIVCEFLPVFETEGFSVWRTIPANALDPVRKINTN